MKHTLRKYLSSRGSALFLVVSTMAALIVLVTAMYLSVLTAGQVQLTVFNQDQAYVSSTAVVDIIQAYFSGTESSELRKTLIAESFAPGSKLSTKGNGFQAFTGLDTDAEETIFGAYDVTITRMNDEGDNYVYDIAVTVSNNKSLETTHALMYVPINNTEIGDMNETFAATGYIPNDVWIDSGTYNGSLYFDAEYVRFGDLVDSGGGLSIKCEMRCAGSLVCDMATSNAVALDEPGEWVIGNNLYIESQPNGYDLGGDSTTPGKIYVGGDLVIKDGTYYSIGGSATEPTDVYVIGDAYICNINDFYGNLYVGGDLYFVGTQNFWSSTADAYNNTPGITNMTGDIYLSGGSDVYISDGLGNYYCEADNYICKQYNGLYYKKYYCKYRFEDDGTGNWHYTAKDASGNYLSGSKRGIGPVELAEFKADCIAWSGKGDAIDHINAVLMQTPFYVWTPDTDDALANQIDIHFDLNNGAATNYVYKIDQDCTINEITASSTGSYQPTILFDTGDEGNQLIVRLGKNNYDSDNNGTNDDFRWMPEGGGCYAVNIITVGKGSLIIDIPAGVKYQANFMDFFGHVAWFEHLGGTYGVDANGCEYFDRSSLDFCTAAGAIGTKILPHIHVASACTDGCAANLQLKLNADGSKYYTCNKHGGEYDEDEYEDIVDSGYCPCNNRLEYTESGFPDSNYGGVNQKANVNIYLVSSDESATVHFSGNSVMNNIYFGFVYAPYMTYMDEGAGGGLKNVGGLIVSDYIMRGAYSYVQCYPDLPLSKIIGDDHKGDGSTSNKPWRVYGV